MFKYIIHLLLIILSLNVAPLAIGRTTEANNQKTGTINQIITEYFTPYSYGGASPSYIQAQEQKIMDELLNVTGEQQFNFPAFPRTWIEMYLGRTKTTTTTAGFDSARIAFAIATLSKTPLPLPIELAVKAASLGIGGSKSTSISYSYEHKTSFIAMSSFRRIDPKATENGKTPIPLVLPASGDVPENNPLRPIMYRKRKKAYFNATEEYPMVGLCKYELSLSITTKTDGKISFHTLDRLGERINDTGQVYSVYSNFFKIDRDTPAQDYLRVKCDEVFAEAVRYLAEPDFNIMVEDIFANYHPEAQCELPEEEILDPEGDETCKKWFHNPRFVMGSYRKANVPRCVLGKEGIPICTLRAKQGSSCPVYEFNGRLTDLVPITQTRNDSLTVGNYSHFMCDEGLKCKPPVGELLQHRVTWKDRLTGINASCKKVK